jgi:hypothetical protein
MAHFAFKSPFRAQRINQYVSFAVLDSHANCTHVELSWGHSKIGVQL